MSFCPTTTRYFLIGNSTRVMTSSHSIPSIKEQFILTSQAKKNLIIGGGIGVVLVVAGIYLAATSGSAHESEIAHNTVNALIGNGAKHAGEGHHNISWLTRVWANIWINAVYFTGISVTGMFVISYKYLAKEHPSRYCRKYSRIWTTGNWIFPRLYWCIWLVSS